MAEIVGMAAIAEDVAPPGIHTMAAMMALMTTMT